MKKRITVRDLVPLVESAGFLSSQAKQILVKSFDSVVRSFHTSVLTAINKIKFNKYTNAVINALEQRLKQDAINQSDKQLKHIIKQSSEVVKVNDYMKEKFARVLSLKSGSVIMFQYTDEQGSVTNRTGLVVGGAEGPDKVFFISKDNEVFLKVLDMTKTKTPTAVYSLLKYMNSIENSMNSSSKNKGRSMSISFTDAVTNPNIRSYVSTNDFRSFNISRISYLSTIKLGTSEV